MESARIKTHLLGHDLGSPCIVASSFLTRDIRLLRSAEEHGAGGVCTKAASFWPRPPFTPDVTVLPGGLSMLVPGDKRPPGEKMLSIVREVKQQGTRMMIIGTISRGGSDSKKWQLIAQEMEKAGADALEVDLSHPFIEEAAETFMARFADLTADAVRAVKAPVGIPVIIKLTPITSDLSMVAQACEQAGADAITITNALPSAPPIDIWSDGLPVSLTLEDLTWSCIAGAAIFPIACYAVAHVAKSVKIPVIGCGGVTTWQDVVKMVMWGASAVQICTAIHLHGFQIIGEINRGLELFLEEKGYSSIEDLRGLALKHIVPQVGAKVKEDYRIAVREDRCNLCMRCLRIGQCLAISLRNNAIVIDNDECVPCGTCVQICPQKAIEVRQRVTA